MALTGSQTVGRSNDPQLARDLATYYVSNHHFDLAGAHKATARVALVVARKCFMIALEVNCPSTPLRLRRSRARCAVATRQVDLGFATIKGSDI